MDLPNRQRAYVLSNKLVGYLLSETHPVGKSKAKFFRRHGFSEDNLELLEQGLLRIAREDAVAETTSSVHGTKFVIRGSLETPRGETIELETVWFIETEDASPRFVTAYPA